MQPSALTPRLQLLWDLHDFSHGRGLEIGPLPSAIVERGQGDVHYVDVYDRPGLLAAYDGDPGVPPERIPEIDYPLFDGERFRTIPEAIGDDARFDWVMASHVVEHVPDLVGWLDEVAQVTVDGGVLVLAVPDRRYCFDVHRPGTTVGQLIEAHDIGHKTPSVRAVYDYKRGHTSVRAPDVWAGRIPDYGGRIYSLDKVLAEVERARRGEYVDAHVWTFTPGVFAEQIIELREIGLATWTVDRLIPTPGGQLEFYAVLRRLPRGGEWDEGLFADEVGRAPLPDWVAELAELRQAGAHADTVELLSRRVEALEARVARQRGRIKRLNDKITRLQQRNARLRARLDALQQSWRWRAGGVVTSPARLVRRSPR